MALAASLAVLLGAACGRTGLAVGEHARDGGPGDSGPAPLDAGGCPDCPDGTVCYPRTFACVPECTCRNSGDCDDGLACNGAETCDGCICQPGPGIVCNEDAIDCTDVLCNDETGGCVVFPDHTRCPPDQICVPERGGCVPIPCYGDLECDDGFYCN